MNTIEIFLMRTRVIRNSALITRNGTGYIGQVRLIKIVRVSIMSILLSVSLIVNAQEKIFPGADEKTPSRAQYFSWINNTNEGADETHTMINLDFFAWLKSEYGMQLDI